MKRVKFGVSGHRLAEMHQKPLDWFGDLLTDSAKFRTHGGNGRYADVSWPLSELVRLWLQFVDFSNFDAVLT